MTAAAENLKEEGDGLFYYLFFAGLPGFIFGRPESPKNSIVVFTPLRQRDPAVAGTAAPGPIRYPRRVIT